MQDERSRTRPGREVGTDVVGDAMVFPQSLKQQAGHARAQVALQQPQGQIIGISMAAAGCPRVSTTCSVSIGVDTIDVSGWTGQPGMGQEPLRRLPMTAGSGRIRCVG